MPPPWVPAWVRLPKVEASSRCRYALSCAQIISALAMALYVLGLYHHVSTKEMDSELRHLRKNLSDERKLNKSLAVLLGIQLQGAESNVTNVTVLEPITAEEDDEAPGPREQEILSAHVTGEFTATLFCVAFVALVISGMCIDVFCPKRNAEDQENDDANQPPPEVRVTQPQSLTTADISPPMPLPNPPPPVGRIIPRGPAANAEGAAGDAGASAPEAGANSGGAGANPDGTGENTGGASASTGGAGENTAGSTRTVMTYKHEYSGGRCEYVNADDNLTVKTQPEPKEIKLTGEVLEMGPMMSNRTVHDLGAINPDDILTEEMVTNDILTQDLSPTSACITLDPGTYTVHALS